MLLRWDNSCHYNIANSSRSPPVGERQEMKINIEQVVYTTVTATSDIPLQSCTNYGLEYATYPFVSHSDYDPTIYKSTTPDVSGVTDTFSFFTNGDGLSPQSVYGSQPVEVDLIAVNHRGYFIAPQSGTYNFTLNSVDDWYTLWVGSVAYSGWTLDNALFTQQW